MLKSDIFSFIKSLNNFVVHMKGIKNMSELTKVVEKILDELMYIEYSGLYLYDFKEEKLKLLVAKGFTETEKKEAEKTAMQRHPGAVFMEKKMLHIKDLESEKEDALADIERSFVVRSRLYIPVMDGEKAVGVFGLVSSERNKFTDIHIEVLTLICNLAGRAYGELLHEEELKQAQKEIIDLSRFPTENPNPVLRISFEGVLLYANKASDDLMECQGCTVGSEVKPNMMSLVDEVVKSNKSKEMEYSCKDKIYSLIFTPQFEGRYINLYGRDITKRKNVEKELSKLALIASHNDNAIIITGPEGTIQWVNEAFTKRTEFKLDEVIGKIPGDFLQGPKTNPETVKAIAIAIQNKTFIETDIINYSKSGKEYWVQLQIQPIFDENHELNHFISIQKDITDKKKFELELKVNQEKTRLIIDTALDAVIQIDSEGRITDWNKQAGVIFGWDSEEALGKYISDLIIPHNFRSAHIAGMKKYNETGIGPVLNKRIELTAMNKDGSEFPIELTVTPIHSETGTTFSAFLRDITDQKRNEHELQEARREAEIANAAKSQFLANMSHEIRTPLNAIYGLTKLLNSTSMDDEQKKLTDGISNSSQGLLEIINQILDLSKIEAGLMSLEEINFSLRDLVNNVFSAIEFKAAEKNIELKLDLDPELKCNLIGDRLRLYQVLMNLLNNAVKFTHQGEVSLVCKKVKASPEECAIKFLVRDTGIGIARENLPLIFQSFQQEDSSTTRNYGGTGLGLPISKQLVELMGGNLEVESDKGQGTTFYFTLSFKIGPSEVVAKPVEHTLDSSIDIQGRRVLVVDDNKFNQFLAKSFLEKFDVVVLLANDGKQALDILSTESIDLVLMDLQMPVMGGVEATLIIREQLKLDIPVIALTANVIKGVIDQCKEAGMNDYLSKPFEPEELIEKVIFWTGRKREPQQDSSESLPDENSAQVYYDLSGLEKMLSGDKEQVKIMVGKFIDLTPGYLEDLTSAIDSRDFEKAAKAAHKLKSSIQLVAVPEIKTMVQEIHDKCMSPSDPEIILKDHEVFNEKMTVLLKQLRSL